MNRKATAKIRYATGLRNSFGRYWYLTDYGYIIVYDNSDDNKWKVFSSADRAGFNGNVYAQKEYQRVDALMSEAISEFINPEVAAQAQLDMMNHATLIKRYPDTKVASYIRTLCDNYYDYAFC